MDFTQVSPVKWESYPYRITKSELSGRYYACVRCQGPMWDFAWHPRPYRTWEAARRACETNERFWRAVERARAMPKRKAKLRLAALTARGKRAHGSNVIGFPPIGAEG